MESLRNSAQFVSRQEFLKLVQSLEQEVANRKRMESEIMHTFEKAVQMIDVLDDKVKSFLMESESLKVQRSTPNSPTSEYSPPVKSKVIVTAESPYGKLQVPRELQKINRNELKYFRGMTTAEHDIPYNLQEAVPFDKINLPVRKDLIISSRSDDLSRKLQDIQDYIVYHRLQYSDWSLILEDYLSERLSKPKIYFRGCTEKGKDRLVGQKHAE